MFLAKRLVLLAVALRDGDGAVVVNAVKGVIRDISNVAKTASTVQELLEAGLDAGPDLYAGKVAGVGHGNIVHVQILDNISLIGVLTKRTNGDAVGAGAVQVLDDNICAVRFEGYAIWSRC